MNLELLFPQPIWLDVVDGADFSEAITYCKKIQKESSGRIVSNRGGWQSDFLDLFNTKELSAVSAVVQKKLEFLSSQFDKSKFTSLTCTAAWANISNKHCHNIKHAHVGSTFAGCIYLKIPSNSGKIVFYRDDYMTLFPVPKGVYDPVLVDSVTYAPRDGMILLFPAWLEHGVEMSESDEDRISIAFNIDCK